MKFGVFLSVFLLFCWPALAEGWQSFEATTTAEVELRGAPGPYKPIAIIPPDTTLVIGVCFKQGEWCQVSNNDFSGFADAALLRVGNQTVQERYSEYWQDILNKSASALKIFTSRNIWTEGDSYMQGAHDVSLSKLIADTSFRQTKGTARGGATMNEIASRLQAAENRLLRPRVVVIWDGSPNGLQSVEDYVDQLKVAIEGLGHNHFVIVPPLHGGEPTRTNLAKEFKANWPDNVLDWRDVLGDYDSEIPKEWLAKPKEDQVHLGLEAMRKMASKITEFIRSKGW